MNDRQGSDREPEPKVDAMAIVGTLLAGPLCWGGIGWLADWLTDRATPLFLPIGILLGLGGSIYLVWRRLPKH
ncbi:AtpZ/AtpI family protein [Allonocardiopsis opalescens]|uniref:Putative F0F1-ATPase subunit (Ca2+/Mg2+ transporter) n=1 Tax=Allonocardiopsis opalescens TaxID=1144618 RepID=A0A2T0QD05_9ACTN|nr:AtpZ/AtpI family protein [Allonocardiopsis opalescens]PRY01785.1 putative F0F1-ATPase subunit (Ca2+/Mg2+ transporter) [Allonocardiopsis opalescens]